MYSIQAFFSKRLGKLTKGLFLQTQALLANSNSILFAQHDPPTHKCLFRNLAFGHVKEYSRVVCALAPFSPAPTSFDTTSAFTTLHPKSNGYFPLFLEDYEPE
jgi:hypothetical protein